MNASDALNSSDAALAIGPLPSDRAADTGHLLKLAHTMREEEARVLGFPGNLDFDLSELAPLLGVFFNSVGDPDCPDASNVGAKPYEQAVLEYFTTAAGAAPADIYGYVASSSTEALVHGLAAARRVLPKACVYASDQAHYSVQRACDLLRMELVTVSSKPGGSMDAEDLRIQSFARRRITPAFGRGPGAIVVATCGTTMRGAVDDITMLRRAAMAAGAVYMHVDAAGGGLIAAYSDPQPNWSFAHGADSVNISGHKVLGLPVPAGISLVRRDLLPAARGGEYIAATDRTLACSRSGLAALLLWARLRALGTTGMAALVHRGQEMAAYAVGRLEQAGVNPGRFPGSLTVTFDRPPPWVAAKWHLACTGRLAHIVTVGHITHAAVDELAADLTTARQTAAA
ncbi:pyridoxal-dependent decarboxylase [Streptomyces sp. NPDC057445]|uniref:pyridoxal-dependent decarboxylase n=1 Tax=Streptomyces sp. NPDC057445 TaxID=3346136 RepID=UPI0036989643